MLPVFESNITEAKMSTDEDFIFIPKKSLYEKSTIQNQGLRSSDQWKTVRTKPCCSYWLKLFCKFKSTGSKNPKRIIIFFLTQNNREHIVDLIKKSICVLIGEDEKLLIENNPAGINALAFYFDKSTENLICWVIQIFTWFRLESWKLFLLLSDTNCSKRSLKIRESCFFCSMFRKKLNF